MIERVKINVKVSSEVNTILHDLFNQIQYEFCEQYEEEIERLNSIIKEVREYITSYESISTIQGLEEIEANKDLDEKTLNEMVRRYMIVHDKVLEILDKRENKINEVMSVEELESYEPRNIAEQEYYDNFWD